MGKQSGIDAAWETLFARHDILTHIRANGTFSITSAQINQVKEARLMAKFDRSAQLPQIFRRNQLSILPVSRGGYVLGPFETHREVSYADVRPRPVPIPDLETLSCTDLYSEAAALLFCHNSGIFRDLLGSDRVYQTVGGRMASGCFDFRINNTLNPAAPFRLSVCNAQVEIDGGYESPDVFCLVEAKNMAVGELLIRQLYYPYRLWCSKIRKPVVPVFLVCSNDLFHLFRYRFLDDEDYNSLSLVNHTAYTFSDQSITISDVRELWQRTRPDPEPHVPFPQADTFARVVDLLGVLHERPLDRDEVTLKYEFDPRQTDYYVTACQYLGLTERFQTEAGPGLRLTEEARRIMALPWRQKYLALMACILRRPVFHRAFGRALQLGDVPNRDLIIRMMLESGLPLNGTTMNRRASTVRGWVGWMLAQCGEGMQLSLL